jgi:hypothetical protein
MWIRFTMFSYQIQAIRRTKMASVLQQVDQEQYRFRFAGSWTGGIKNPRFDDQREGKVGWFDTCAVIFYIFCIKPNAPTHIFSRNKKQERLKFVGQNRARAKVLKIARALVLG